MPFILARRVAWSIVVLAALLPSLMSCTGSAGNSPSSAGASESYSRSRWDKPEFADPDKTLNAIAAAPTPAGVDPAVFAVLKAALACSLREGSGGKLASIAPAGEANVVRDLRLEDNGAGGMNLRWTYLNTGDTDRNMEVNLADLVPLGIYYGKRSTDPGWDAARVADCDGNGEVNVADVTPIGMHFLSRCTAYNIFGSDSYDGPWSFLETEFIPAPPGTGPLVLLHTLSSDSSRYYTVVPVDDLANEGARSLPAVQIPQPAIVNLGNVVVQDMQMIGPDGGELDGAPGSPLDRVRVIIPAGALAEAKTLTLGYNEGMIDLAGLGAQHSPLVVLGAEGVSDFALPIDIRVPANPGDDTLVLAGVSVDAGGKLQLLGPLGAEPDTAEYSMVAFYPGTFGSLQFSPDAINPLHAWGTGFQPDVDGFVIPNSGSTFSPGGECAGMSSFSLWYWLNKKWTGDFYGRFTYPVGMGLTAEHLIKTRAFNSIAQQYDAYCSNYLWYRKQSDWFNYVVIRSFLAASAEPVMIDLAYQTSDIGSGVHSVLAYGFDDTGIEIYDPNVPATRSFMNWNGVDVNDQTGTLTYSAFDRVAYWGGGSLYVTESYENIYGDAINAFNGLGEAQLVVTSHSDGEQVATGYATIGGTIHSFALLVTKLKAYVNGKWYTTNVPETGVFSIKVPIAAGQNDIYFLTYGYHATPDKELFIENDQLFLPLTLIGNVQPAKISAVLTWARDDTDVDLYVLDPYGDASYYSHPLMSGGGELSLDNSTGYGPEYWSLRADDTILYGMEYRIRAHYFDSRGHGGTICTLKLVTDEGSSYQLTKTLFGYLKLSDSANTNPEGIGSDWKDLAVVIPVSHGASSVRVEETAGGVPRIYLPVR